MMGDCKAWDDFVLEADNLLVSMIDVGELSASTMEIYPRDLLAISWANAELNTLRSRLSLAEAVVEAAKRHYEAYRFEGSDLECLSAEEALFAALRAYSAAKESK